MGGWAKAGISAWGLFRANEGSAAPLIITERAEGRIFLLHRALTIHPTFPAYSTCIRDCFTPTLPLPIEI